MCGICGIWGRDDAHLASRMLHRIRHRGPDSFDVASCATWSVGGCRLGIVARPSTPLPRVDGESVIVFNGEVYNYRSVALELGIGNLDASDPESDLIQRVLRLEGWRGLSRLQGMFAIASLSADRALLARDHLGVKPLFYAFAGDDLVFGSEMKAIFADERVSSDLDDRALDEIAVFGFIASPERTPFAAIRQVPPGCVVEIAEGQPCVHRLRETRPAHDGSRDVDATNAVTDRLRRGVSQMLQHDSLDKGFYLSGGIDSSLLVLLASEHEGQRLRTFTLSDGECSPDIEAARAVAKAVGSEHYEYRASLGDYLVELPLFVLHYENLIAGGVFGAHGGMAFQILSRRVAQHVRVAFSGEGADELFGGYYWPFTHPLGFSDGIRAKLRALGSPAETSLLVDRLFPSPEDEALYRRSVFDVLTGAGLGNYHLWSVDRSCSAFGFEVRPAYLHDDLVDLAFSLPVEAKASKTETKRVLRAAALPLFHAHGLSRLVYRKKTGMPSAVDRIAVEFAGLAASLVPQDVLDRHPFGRWIDTPEDAVMFDLLHFLFVVNRGTLPDGFELAEFYRSGDCARMYC